MSDFPPRCIIHGLPQGFTCFLYQEDRNTSAALSSYHHSCWRLPRVQAARIGRCRPCPLRDQCLGYGTATKRPRRVSAVLWPQSSSPPTNLPAVQELASCSSEKILPQATQAGRICLNERKKQWFNVRDIGVREAFKERI